MKAIEFCNVEAERLFAQSCKHQNPRIYELEEVLKSIITAWDAEQS
jgi:hypothetical protein